MLLSKAYGPFSLAFSTLVFSKPPSRIGLKPLSIVDELQEAVQAAKISIRKAPACYHASGPRRRKTSTASRPTMVARHPLTIDHTIERTPFAPRKLSALFPQVLLRSWTVNLRRALSNTTAYRSPSAPEIRPLRLFIVPLPRSQIAASAPLITPKPSRIPVYVRGRGTGFRHSTSPYAFRGARAPQTRPRVVSETATQADPLDPEISLTFVWKGYAPEWALLNALLLSFSGFRRR
ncbi:hypothetical protein B0H14DRAFT_2735349 [Mycena olivaceomarginata]|nr:hypothetical protein B0H14DRAFT_2735349 [Mycena olivaceomarginata]